MTVYNINNGVPPAPQVVPAQYGGQTMNYDPTNPFQAGQRVVRDVYNNTLSAGQQLLTDPFNNLYYGTRQNLEDAGNNLRAFPESAQQFMQDPRGNTGYALRQTFQDAGNSFDNSRLEPVFQRFEKIQGFTNNPILRWNKEMGGIQRMVSSPTELGKVLINEIKSGRSIGGMISQLIEFMAALKDYKSPIIPIIDQNGIKTASTMGPSGALDPTTAIFTAKNSKNATFDPLVSVLALMKDFFDNIQLLIQGKAFDSKVLSQYGSQEDIGMIANSINDGSTEAINGVADSMRTGNTLQDIATFSQYVEDYSKAIKDDTAGKLKKSALEGLNKTVEGALGLGGENKQPGE